MFFWSSLHQNFINLSGYFFREKKIFERFTDSLLEFSTNESKQNIWDHVLKRMDQAKLLQDSFKKTWSDHSLQFKGCLPQTLLDPFLNTLSHAVFPKSGNS